MSILAPLLPCLMAAAPMKVAMIPLHQGAGVDQPTAEAISEAVASHLRKRPHISLITQSEIRTLLNHEQQQQLLGCSDESCYADIGGALGAERLVWGSLAHLGKSWMIHLKILEVQKARVLQQADRRLKNATIDDILDALPELARTLLAEGAVEDQRPTKPHTAAALPNTKRAPYDGELKGLTIVTDGKGHYVAYGAPMDGPVFGGDGKTMVGQRLGSQSRNGNTAWSFGFWDPRAQRGAERQLEHRDGKTWLRCGPSKIALYPISATEQKRLLRAATFLKPLWQRTLDAAARDDFGQYYVVDAPRGDKNGERRLYVGTKGAMASVPVADSIHDSGGTLLITKTGRLKLTRDKKAFWHQDGRKTELTRLNIYQQAPMLYGRRGPYGGQPLGTVCDPYLGKD